MTRMNKNTKAILILAVAAFLIFQSGILSGKLPFQCAGCAGKTFGYYQYAAIQCVAGAGDYGTKTFYSGTETKSGMSDDTEVQSIVNSRWNCLFRDNAEGTTSFKINTNPALIGQKFNAGAMITGTDTAPNLINCQLKSAGELRTYGGIPNLYYVNDFMFSTPQKISQTEYCQSQFIGNVKNIDKSVKDIPTKSNWAYGEKINVKFILQTGFQPNAEISNQPAYCSEGSPQRGVFGYTQDTETGIYVIDWTKVLINGETTQYFGCFDSYCMNTYEGTNLDTSTYTCKKPLEVKQGEQCSGVCSTPPQYLTESSGKSYLVNWNCVQGQCIPAKQEIGCNPILNYGTDNCCVFKDSKFQLQTCKEEMKVSVCPEGLCCEANNAYNYIPKVCGSGYECKDVVKGVGKCTGLPPAPNPNIVGCADWDIPCQISKFMQQTTQSIGSWVIIILVAYFGLKLVENKTGYVILPKARK